MIFFITQPIRKRKETLHVCSISLLSCRSPVAMAIKTKCFSIFFLKSLNVSIQDMSLLSISMNIIKLIKLLHIWYWIN